MGIKVKGTRHVVTAADVTATTIDIKVSDLIGAVQSAQVTVRTAAGVVKAWDGAVALGVDGVVTVDNTGAVDWAATDTIDVHAS